MEYTTKKCICLTKLTSGIFGTEFLSKVYYGKLNAIKQVLIQIPFSRFLSLFLIKFIIENVF